MPQIAADVRQGLSRSPKSLPARLLWDAEGSAIFEEVTRLREYYLTRIEQELLRKHASAIIESAHRPASLIELGAGTAEKPVPLLAALARARPDARYCPIDLSASALRQAQRRLAASLPALPVHPLVDDFTAGIGWIRRLAPPRLVAFIGSSIGNFEPLDGTAFLSAIVRALSPGGSLLLGTAMVKPAPMQQAAYDDAAGVTAQFNRNVLARIDRELGGEFDLSSFRHVAWWNQDASRVEMHLESSRHPIVPIRLLRTNVELRGGERIHAENCYEFTPASLRTLIEPAGFHVARIWTNPQRWFCVSLSFCKGAG